VKFYAAKKKSGKKNQLQPTRTPRVAKVDAENIALRWKIAAGVSAIRANFKQIVFLLENLLNCIIMARFPR